MRLKLDQKGGSLLFHAGTIKVYVKAGQECEVPDSLAPAVMAEYPALVVVENEVEPVVVADVPAPEPPPEMTQEPQVAEVATSTTGAISTADLKPGGKRGGRRRKAT